MKKEHVNFYLQNLQGVNNWDIVDLSCYKILGDAIAKNLVSGKILSDFSKDKSIWKRRIAIVSTLQLIRVEQFYWTEVIAKRLLKDEEDLIHKAIGWML